MSWHAGEGRRRGARRGQTLFLALAILFLLVILGGIFVSLILRNLNRASRQGASDDALSLALAGIRYAAQQFRSSPRGAEWRPVPTEPLWRDPIPTAPLAALRALDPDQEWLDPARTNNLPFVRVPTRGGRFLIRVTYLPAFRPSSAAAEAANAFDQFDPNSRFVLVEAIGRPGEFDPNDPTSFAQDPTAVSAPGNVRGPQRKVEAYVPVGLLDQLWWVTNLTGERGPAKFGATPFFDELRNPREYPLVLEGGVRADVDLKFTGRTVIRLYPARGEAIRVKGNIDIEPRSNVTANPGQPPVRLDILDDTAGGAPGQVPPDNQDDDPSNDIAVAQGALQPSATLNPFALPDSGLDVKYLVSDDRRRWDDTLLNVRSTRQLFAPSLDASDPTTGKSRLLLLTRDSGQQLTYTDFMGVQRTANSGAFGLVDQALPAVIRAKGFYLDNFGDIQYPNDRAAVKNEWLRRSRTGANYTGWLGEFYVPSVVEEGVNHPIAEIELIAVGGVPKLRVRRYDLDVRQMNLAPDTGRQRRFYRLTNFAVSPGMGGGTGTLEPVGHVQIVDYPENGMVFAEGSVRVRGLIGGGQARQLTIVSGGTIYIEGNLRKGRPDAFLGLMARDFICLNPTAFTRVQPGDDVIVEADTFDPQGRPVGYHFNIPQGSDLDFEVADSGALVGGMLTGMQGAHLHVKHTAPLEDNASRTAVNLIDALGGYYNFGTLPQDNAGNPIPPPPGDPPYFVGNQLFYLFRQIGSGEPNFWHDTNRQTISGNPANFERKTFFLPALTTQPGLPTYFRIAVGPEGPSGAMSPNGQPYWLSRIALLPDDRPLAVQIEAVMYAQTGSWFVVPPPVFNDNPQDTRANFAATGLRDDGTFPKNTDHFPFFGEALNISINIHGAVTENFPAEPSETAEWSKKLWVFDPGYDHSDFPEPPAPVFSPNLRYRYDANLRRMIRVRFTRPYQAHPTPFAKEEVVWVAPGPPPPGQRDFNTVLAEAIGNNSYVETLPVLPGLPGGALIYEGNPLL